MKEIVDSSAACDLHGCTLRKKKSESTLNNFVRQTLDELKTL